MKLFERIKLSFKYRINKLEYLFISFFNELVKKSMNPPIVKNTQETIQKIIEDRCSISRYGEGEFKLMYGEDLLFQEYSDELRLKMNEIIENPIENHIVCIPDVFKSIDRFNENAYRFWKIYLNTDRKKIYDLLDMNRTYYDSLMTRVYMDYKEKDKSKDLFTQLKKIWNKRDLIIVEGEESRLGVGNNLFDNSASISRILCPSKNAFSEYDAILREVNKHSKDRLILVALGPTATVLTYDLCKLGYQAIDIGHVDIEYEWFLKGSLKKCSVKNKFVGEVDEGIYVEKIKDQNYENQIVGIVS